MRPVFAFQKLGLAMPLAFRAGRFVGRKQQQDKGGPTIRAQHHHQFPNAPTYLVLWCIDSIVALVILYALTHANCGSSTTTTTTQCEGSASPTCSNSSPDSCHAIDYYSSSAATICYENLNALLSWMTKAPAGLKLNEPFSYVLGEFFRYHLYLWRTFIVAVRELIYLLSHQFPSINDDDDGFFSLKYFIVGLLGFSGCTGLFSDILNLCLIHINCFYVYAARLYSLQLGVAKSLLRLFIGKKYNPLRGGRIDSIDADANQMFVGTILMTILVFLLPTSAVFYFVFVGMRLVQLITLGTLEVLANWYVIFADDSTADAEKQEHATKVPTTLVHLQPLRVLAERRVRLIEIVRTHGGLFSLAVTLLVGEML